MNPVCQKRRQPIKPFEYVTSTDWVTDYKPLHSCITQGAEKVVPSNSTWFRQDLVSFHYSPVNDIQYLKWLKYQCFDFRIGSRA